MSSRWRRSSDSASRSISATIGVSMHPDHEVRICDTLDWYAPSTSHATTSEDVKGWFVEAGLVDIVDLSERQVFYHEGQGHGINIAGRRPSCRGEREVPPSP